MHRDIPKAIKAQYETRGIVVGQTVWNGVEAMVQVRNALVHTGSNTLNLSQHLNIKVLYDACNLGLYFIELALLARMGYQGEFWNRTKRSTVTNPGVETVPWAT